MRPRHPYAGCRDAGGWPDAVQLGVAAVDTEVARNLLRSDDRVIAIVGSYGSGKTELAVNLCLHLARQGSQVQIADLDLVNPYFRCREARQLMEQQGIRVVVPPGAQSWADLPIVLPEIRAMLRPADGVITVLDVGGDDVGARVLASFRTSVSDGQYELWQVINAKRPFTDTVDGCLAMRQAIEASSRWTVTGLVVNSHLIAETTAGTIVDGWHLAKSVEARTGLPIRFVAAMERFAQAPELDTIEAPLLFLRRHLLPPWLRPESADEAAATSMLPASRPIPIGQPRPLAFTSPKGTL